MKKISYALAVIFAVSFSSYCLDTLDETILRYVEAREKNDINTIVEMYDPTLFCQNPPCKTITETLESGEKYTYQIEFTKGEYKQQLSNLDRYTKVVSCKIIKIERNAYQQAYALLEVNWFEGIKCCPSLWETKKDEETLFFFERNGKWVISNAGNGRDEGILLNKDPKLLAKYKKLMTKGGDYQKPALGEDKEVIALTRKLCLELRSHGVTKNVLNLIEPLLYYKSSYGWNLNDSAKKELPETTHYTLECLQDDFFWQNKVKAKFKYDTGLSYAFSIKGITPEEFNLGYWEVTVPRQCKWPPVPNGEEGICDDIFIFLQTPNGLKFFKKFDHIIY